MPLPNRGSFKKGHVTWNKGLKGLHFSPETEFKKGCRPATWKPVGTITKRRCKGGYIKRFVKIEEPKKWLELTHLIWINEYGEIIKGDKICHLNGFFLDDRIENLIALPPEIYSSFTRWKKPLSEKQMKKYIGRYLGEEIVE